MPNIRIWTTDKDGCEVLHTTVALDKKLNVVDVIHHASEQEREAQRKINTEHLKKAIEELAVSKPDAVKPFMDKTEPPKEMK